MNHSFNITVNDKEIEVTMTYGLLVALSRVIGDDPDKIGAMPFDPDIRAMALIEMLSERDAKGRIIESKKIDPNWMKVESSAVIDLLTFAGEHLLDFFMQAVEKVAEVQKRHEARLEALTPTSIGSQT